MPLGKIPMRLLNAALAAIAPLARRERDALPLAPGANVLICRCDHIGDAIMALPALAALRARHPGARLSVWVATWSEALYRSSGLFDELLVIDPPWWAPRHGRPAGWWRFLRQMRALRGRFDLAVDMRGDLRLLLCLAFLVRPRAIFARDRHGGTALATSAVRIDDGEHEIDQNVQLFAAYSVTEGAPIPLSPSPSAVRRVEQFLAANGICRTGPLVVIHPTAKTVNRWPSENFAALVRSLSARGAEIVITGAPSERATAAALCVAAGGKPANAAGALELVELLALMTVADVFVSADTGPMHLLNIAHTPAVLLFGPTDPCRFAPRVPGHVHLCGTACCRRELHERCLRPAADGSSECMSSISVPAVTAAVLECLRSH